MKRKLILLSATLLTLSVALAACSTSDSTQSAVSDTQSSSAPSSVAVSSSSSSSSSERTYDFDSYILQYEKDNNLTDEEIQADENLKLAMFEWLRDAGVQVGLAVNDKYSGCENIFLDDYIKWCGEQEGVQEEPALEESDDGYTYIGEQAIKKPDSADFFDQEGNFDKEGYLKAIDEYKKKVGEAETAHTEKVVEELGGEILTGDEITEMWEKSEENANKIAEMWKDGTLDEVVNAVNEKKNQ